MAPEGLADDGTKMSEQRTLATLTSLALGLCPALAPATLRCDPALAPTLLTALVGVGDVGVVVA
eukprot:12146508-Alexandrium_andersonii.AAC.1